MNTTTFTLLTGVECEIKELTAKHQRILTEQGKKKAGENMNEVLADILVRVGSRTGPFDSDFIKALVSGDRKIMLVEARKFSLGSDEPGEDGEPNPANVFTFRYDYLNFEGQKAYIEKEVELEDGGNFPTTPYKQQVEEYDDLKKDIEIELPSKKICVFRLLDGFGEAIGNSISKEDRSSHSPLICRNVRLMEWNTDKTKRMPISQRIQDLDKWSLRDIEFLRKRIKAEEGRVDTEERFEHPEAEHKPANEKEVVIDLLTVLSFFFPSSAL